MAFLASHGYRTIAHDRRGHGRSGQSFCFSSRRRHTSSLCDWSSDVCSSDLLVEAPNHVCARYRIAAFKPAMTRSGRSEEHTSELQSHSDLVCRLLLDKKTTGLHGSPTESRERTESEHDRRRGAG